MHQHCDVRLRSLSLQATKSPVNLVLTLMRFSLEAFRYLLISNFTQRGKIAPEIITRNH